MRFVPQSGGVERCLYGPTAGYQIVDEYDNSQYKENMYQAASDMHHESNEPESEQDADYRVKHW